MSPQCRESRPRAIPQSAKILGVQVSFPCCSCAAVEQLGYHSQSSKKFSNHNISSHLGATCEVLYWDIPRDSLRKRRKNPIVECKRYEHGHAD